VSAGNRHRAREYALQVLYGLDVNEVESGSAGRAWAHHFEVELEDESSQFAAALIDDVAKNRDDIDALIQDASKNWRLERMSRVDRNILRLATAELRSATSVPLKVVINEAVELAKAYGAAESPAFVNGILDRIAQKVAAEGH
jgi:N utilization substance protein B